MKTNIKRILIIILLISITLCTYTSEVHATGNHTLDEIIGEADGFLNKGNKTTVDTNILDKGSNSLYIILRTIAIFLMFAIGMYLGIKFMVATSEEKAQVKESLIPYFAACIVIFSAFGIWKLVIVILNNAL